jgi:hypothetical protein
MSFDSELETVKSNMKSHKNELEVLKNEIRALIEDYYFDADDDDDDEEFGLPRNFEPMETSRSFDYGRYQEEEEDMMTTQKRRMSFVSTTPF